jgi:hypothetical protein
MHRWDDPIPPEQWHELGRRIAQDQARPERWTYPLGFRATARAYLTHPAIIALAVAWALILLGLWGGGFL